MYGLMKACGIAMALGAEGPTNPIPLQIHEVKPFLTHQMFPISGGGMTIS